MAMFGRQLGKLLTVNDADADGATAE